MVQVYWIMGRSENSRNRVFVAHAGSLRTVAADPAKVTDPSLIIYRAMAEQPESGHFVVSNGTQTDDVIRSLVEQGRLYDSMLRWSYEPDAPNFTPRIISVCTLKDRRPAVEMSILRRSAFGEGCDAHLYRFTEHGRGIGHCLTTYAGDGDPLPSFSGEPYVLPLVGEIQEVANRYWSALDVNNRVSLAVKFIEIETGATRIHVINKHTAVEP